MRQEGQISLRTLIISLSPHGGACLSGSQNVPTSALHSGHSRRLFHASPLPHPRDRFYWPAGFTNQRMTRLSLVISLRIREASRTEAAFHAVEKGLGIRIVVETHGEIMASKVSASKGKLSQSPTTKVLFFRFFFLACSIMAGVRSRPMLPENLQRCI